MSRGKHPEHGQVSQERAAAGLPSPRGLLASVHTLTARLQRRWQGRADPHGRRLAPPLPRLHRLAP
ncbi:MAG: hypothetical protein QME94_14705, partial [Anaerolineae bacterium]|nr:hypothetical protein [Anaerolineae bacterium]